MKQKLLITERGLVKMMKILIESDFETSDYGEMDLHDIFISVFRAWVKNKFPNQFDNYPLSYLIKKHFVDFAKEFELDLKEFIDYEGEINLSKYRIATLIKQLVSKNKVVLPRVPTQSKITEKYKKAIDFFVKDLNLPLYATLDIQEPKPNKIQINLSFDFQNFIKTKGNIPNRHTLEIKFIEFLENYLGLEIGDPKHGEVQVHVSNPIYNGQDEWVKNTLNKEIKKRIRELPKAKNIHSIRYSITYQRPEIKLTFKDSAGWNDRRELKSGVEKLLEDMGYTNFKVEN